MSDKFAPIAEAIKKAKCSLIKNVRVADTYSDENGKSITVRMVFAHNEKTLTREEVMETANKIIEALDGAGIPLKK